MIIQGSFRCTEIAENVHKLAKSAYYSTQSKAVKSHLRAFNTALNAIAYPIFHKKSRASDTEIALYFIDWLLVNIHAIDLVPSLWNVGFSGIDTYLCMIYDGIQKNIIQVESEEFRPISRTQPDPEICIDDANVHFSTETTDCSESESEQSEEHPTEKVDESTSSTQPSGPLHMQLTIELEPPTRTCSCPVPESAKENTIELDILVDPDSFKDGKSVYTKVYNNGDRSKSHQPTDSEPEPDDTPQLTDSAPKLNDTLQPTGMKRVDVVEDLSAALSECEDKSAVDSESDIMSEGELEGYDSF